MRSGRLIAVLVFTAALLVGVARPCFACSCAPASDKEHYARADAVFTGKATERHDPSAGGPQGSADPIHWTFDVDGAQKGRTTDPVVVETSRDEASCGITFVVGRRYQVYATNTGEYLHTDLCSGTRELNASQGPYVPPDTTPAPPPAPATPSPAATAAPTPTVSPSPSPTPTATPTPVVAPSPAATDLAAPTSAGRSAAAAVAATLLALTALGLAIGLTIQRSRSS